MQPFHFHGGRVWSSEEHHKELEYEGNTVEKESEKERNMSSVKFLFWTQFSPDASLT